jgi:dipeptidyl aminopeptidase/acylaminoacyl peptidase
MPIKQGRAIRAASPWCAALVAIAGIWLGSHPVASQPKPVAVEDAIEMSRILRIPAQHEETGYFSPDGTRFVSVVWKGNLERNVNLYSLLLFDLRHEKVASRTLLTWELTSVERNQYATPFSRISFLPDNRTVAFVGRPRGEVAQVYALDTETGKLRRLTEHPTAVLSYALSPRGQIRFFSATAETGGSECRSLYRSGGLSLFDRRLDDENRIAVVSRRAPGHWAETADLLPIIDALTGRRCESSGWSFSPTSKYFFVSESRGKPVPLLEDSAEGILTRIPAEYMSFLQQAVSSPTGTHAVLFPGRRGNVDLARRYQHFQGREPESNTTSIALIDLKTKKDRVLSAVPVDLNAQSRIFWSQDGRSVITRSLLPLDASSDAENKRRASLSPQLAEIDVATGRVAAIESASNAEPLTIDRDGHLVVREGNRLLRLHKQGGRWSDPVPLADLDAAGFNRRYTVSTNSKMLVGVRDGLTTPPEIATYDVQSRKVNVLTDLNPTLKQRAFGTVEKVFWKGPYDSASFGYLVKPVGFVEGRRYPLIILFRDSGPDTSDDSFLIDGQQQLSGHAVQPLAGVGFVVLFTPAPPSLRSVLQTPDEGPRAVAHVESGIDYLDGRGLIDRSRVAIGGWSRAAFWTDYVLMHSRHPFKAGVHIDGANYEAFMERNCGTATPTTDACSRNFDKLTAPRLSQQHQFATVISESSLITKLKTLGKAVDFYVYPDEPHDLRVPERRRHSLTLNMDWYRFWLQNYEDSNPEKRVQYERWRALRDGHQLN